MKKITIKYSITDESGCPSRSYEHTIPYIGYFALLEESLERAIDLFKYKQKEYRQKYIKEWGKDPFEGWEDD